MLLFPIRNTAATQFRIYRWIVSREMSSVDKIESEVAASVTPTTPTTPPVRKSDFYFAFNHILMKRSRLEWSEWSFFPGSEKYFRKIKIISDFLIGARYHTPPQTWAARYACVCAPYYVFMLCDRDTLRSLWPTGHYHTHTQSHSPSLSLFLSYTHAICTLTATHSDTLPSLWKIRWRYSLWNLLSLSISRSEKKSFWLGKTIFQTHF